MKSYRIYLCVVVLLVGFLYRIPKANTPAISYEKNTLPTHLPEILLRIADCESNNQQFEKDGKTVKRGLENRRDVGRFQINEIYHLAEAKALGYDIYTWDGNTKMALWLYKHQGTKPWNWSGNCWR